MTIRPLTIKVINRETKQPVPGVSVFYSLNTIVFQKYVLFVIPNIEPEIGPKVAYKRRAITNANGEVKFHTKDFVLPKNERFVGEEVFVNIDADMTKNLAKTSKESLQYYYSESRVRREGPVDNIDLVEWFLMTGTEEERNHILTNPIESLSGAVIVSMAYQPSRQIGLDKTRFKSEENLSLTYAGDTLDKSEDFIVVELYQHRPKSKI